MGHRRRCPAGRGGPGSGRCRRGACCRSRRGPGRGRRSPSRPTPTIRRRADAPGELPPTRPSGGSARSSWPASRLPTPRIPRRSSRPWPRPPSSSRSRPGPPRSPHSPTWSFRSGSSPRSPAPCWTGRVAPVRSARSCGSRRPSPTPARCRWSPARWVDRSARSRWPTCAPSSPGWAAGRVPRPEAQLDDEPATEAPGAGQVVLASWRHLLDEGVLQRGEQALAGTARPALARVSAATADAHGLVDGEPVTVTSGSGSITLPLAVTEMVDGVVWVPGNSIGSTVNATLRVGSGAAVALSAGGAQ